MRLVVGQFRVKLIVKIKKGKVDPVGFLIFLYLFIFV